MALNAWCFSKEALGGVISRFGDNMITINGGEVVSLHSDFGTIVNAFWNNEGALVITDSNGRNHYFVGSGRSFVAYKGEKGPHDAAGYKKALKECEAERKRIQKYQDRNSYSNKKSSKSSSKKGPWWWRMIKGLFKGLLKLIGFSFLIATSDDK